MNQEPNPFRQPETRDKDDVVYYYSRERRLDRAGPNAQFAASLWNTKKQGFLKTMMATRTLRYMFLMLVLFTMLGFAVDFLMKSRDKGNLAGYNVQMRAMYFEGNVIVTLQRIARNDKVLPVEFEVLLTAGDQTVSGTIPTLTDSFGARLASDGKPNWVAAIVGYEGKQIELAVRVD
ncbi:MAG: hypothetical protein KKI09_04200 [Spirochaetes bacterium]|nr:hypothetical protein [Spirochaetota bacterium]MBU0954611.1 hypothetical protein [Spirochaetota bacterium]